MTTCRIFLSSSPQVEGVCKERSAGKIFATMFSDSFTLLGLWVLGLVVSHINESNYKLMSPEHYFIFNDKSAILLHPGTR